MVEIKKHLFGVLITDGDYLIDIDDEDSVARVHRRAVEKPQGSMPHPKLLGVIVDYDPIDLIFKAYDLIYEDIQRNNGGTIS